MPATPRDRPRCRRFSCSQVTVTAVRRRRELAEESDSWLLRTSTLSVCVSSDELQTGTRLGDVLFETIDCLRDVRGASSC